MKKKKYKYVGRAAIPLIPARDLTEEEAAHFCAVASVDEDFLVKSGLYEAVKPKLSSAVNTKKVKHD